jgi:UDP-glucuronate 4-epimerase
MTILVTGCAGFIGSFVAKALLDRGERVLGIDSLNAYYDPALKQARLDRLLGRNNFEFQRTDIADRAAIEALAGTRAEIDRIVHLAAQAGVRYSLTEPRAYVRANLVGQLEILELARALPRLGHLVYASSSSVYGGNRKLPFSVEDPVDRPISLYAASKKADELMSHAYSHLFGLPMTGLRFFSVYGPWGRPDMAAWLFTAAILKGEPITLFGEGDMRRDFTFVDDIVAGVLAALDRPPTAADGEAAHRLYNLGNHRSEPVPKLVSLIEKATGRTATIRHAPMQPGDVRETYADIEATTRDLGFRPTTPIEEGIPRFVTWYRGHYGV